MADTVLPHVRAQNMSAVKGRDTKPELAVRRALHLAGFRFRLHRRDLPGTPDIVLPRYHIAIFVHGCFWHGHDCRKGKRPTSNVDFWERKLSSNAERDRTAARALERAGWLVVVVWECELPGSTSELLTLLTELRRARGS